MQTPSNDTLKQALFALAISVILGVLLSLCFAPISLPLAPFAIAMLLGTLEFATVRKSMLLGLGIGVVFFGISLRWLGTMFGAAAITLWVLSALFPMIACGLYTWLRPRLPRMPIWLLFPILWTGTEYFRSELMLPSFTWMGLGYSLVNSPLLVWPARFIGCYGVTFLICMLGAGLFWMLNHIHDCYIPAALLLVMWWPLSVHVPRHEPRSGVSIRLVQALSEDDDDLLRLSREKSDSQFHPDLILWPEDSFVSDPHKTPKLWPKLAALPVETNSWFLFGARDDAVNDDVNGFRKAAYLLNPRGELVGKHFKNHLVPLFREGVAGREAHAVETPFGKVGIGICFDLDFQDVAVREVNEGAELLLAPSDNPIEWGALQHIQHKQLFQMRAIECDRWIATADTGGNTYTVAPMGQIVRSLKTDDPGQLDVVVNRIDGHTLCVRGGWRFGQLCLAGLAALWVAGITRRVNPETDHQSDDSPQAA